MPGGVGDDGGERRRVSLSIIDSSCGDHISGRHGVHWVYHDPNDLALGCRWRGSSAPGSFGDDDGTPHTGQFGTAGRSPNVGQGQVEG